VPQPLEAAERWMVEQRALWQRRLDQLDNFLKDLKVPEGSKGEKAVTRLDLLLERVVDVPPELVWAAWTVPEHVKQWFTPAPWTTVDCEIDLRPGGIFRTVMRSPEGQEFPNVGCYLEIIKSRKLVWTVAL